MFGTNTRIEGLKLGSFAPGDLLEISFSFRCFLTRQEYTLTVATQHKDGRSQDWLDDLIAFTVIDKRDVAGLANFKTTVKWTRIPADERSEAFKR